MSAYAISCARMAHWLLAAAVAIIAPAAVAQPTPDEARKIAADAYIYGFPIVDSYKTLYAQAIDTGGPDFSD